MGTNHDLQNKRPSSQKAESHDTAASHTNGNSSHLPVRILLVEDHTLVREALASLLSLDKNIHIIGETGNGTEAVQLIASLQPAIVLLDLSLPGLHGTDIIRQVKARFPDIKCLVLTVHMSEPIVRAALQAGAAGYLLKEASHAELKTAIYSVAQGKMYLSPMITDKVLSGYLGNPASAPSESNPWHRLSDREREALKLVAEGATSKEIAKQLCISIRTVEKHRASLMSKLNLKSTAALTAYAIKHELVSSADVLRLDLLQEDNL
ncbi:MAG: response regulator transcription factor [Nitrospira sp.]|nr:response regulator transcription factor [Nitrospira sp.]THJ22580.1 MAG: response regulator transcription factor [Nitrospira sp. CG24D]